MADRRNKKDLFQQVLAFKQDRPVAVMVNKN
jgi:hypothetical protein